MKIRLLHLDGIRGLLALTVILGHWLGSRLGWGNVNFSHSYISVDGFFILSGFVLAYVYSDKLKSNSISWSCYSLHRLARLYPLHILTMFFTYLIYSNFYTAYPFEDPLKTAIYNLLLVHGMGLSNSWSWNDPSWSISVEFFCSVLVFPLLLKIRRNITLATISAIGYVLVIAVHQNLMASNDLHLYILSSGFIKSISGMSLGVLVKNAVTENGKLEEKKAFNSLMQLLTLSFISYFIYTKDLVTSYDGIAIIAIAYFIYSTTIHDTILTKILSSYIISGIGKISFSLYLFHTPLMLILDQIPFYAESGFKTQSAIFYTSLIIISVIGYNLFELPSYKYLKKKTDMHYIAKWKNKNAMP
ncbi:acyltransferase 3 [Rahnella aceris]|uniref:Acyltransferase 3 n=1 Tax=Rahnella sp. (strain Y9602) TaxID=2703885 RepID=A0A0H3F948_RAHSY|nr:acyltransferase [Rahnella aceris]ADW73443.1 acyltransferase 3 [Rahnella aceris]